jgi:hypothetical protein
MRLGAGQTVRQPEEETRTPLPLGEHGDQAFQVDHGRVAGRMKLGGPVGAILQEDSRTTKRGALGSSRAAAL